MKQSKKLTDFYNAYNDWLEEGAPIKNKYNFVRHAGICRNLDIYITEKYHDFDTSVEIEYEMKTQFKNAGLHHVYPFGYESYEDRRYKSSKNVGTQHRDPNRIRWVKQHLKTRVRKDFKLV